MDHPKEEITKILGLLKNCRRDLHMIPEPGSEVTKTRSYIHSVLKKMNCRIIPAAQNGICAFFDFDRPDTAAYRSDMDALPMTESGDLSYASKHPGFMHACGHDGHMAALLGLAYIINTLNNAPCNILLIFQPAEETTGGAKMICDSGILKDYNVKRIFGIHLWPGLEAGRPASRPGVMMAGSCEVTVTATGKSIHCAEAAEETDAIRALCDFLDRSYSLPRVKISAMPSDMSCLLRFGKIYGGSARNTVADHAVLEGTLRCLAEDKLKNIFDELRKIAFVCEKKHGCTMEIAGSEGYLPVYNDPSLYDEISSALGKDYLALCSPVMLAEDFSFYQRQVPGIFFFLGTGEQKPLHSNDFDFDEGILVDAVELYLKIL